MRVLVASSHHKKPLSLPSLRRIAFVTAPAPMDEAKSINKKEFFQILNQAFQSCAFQTNHLLNGVSSTPPVPVAVTSFDSASASSDFATMVPLKVGT